MTDVDAAEAGAAPPRDDVPLGLRWVGPDPSPDGSGQFTRNGMPSGTLHSIALHVGGVGAVGYVMWYCWPQRRDLRWRFHWSCHLPGAACDSDRAGTETRSYAEARRELEDEVRGWLRRAGLGVVRDEGVRLR